MRYDDGNDDNDQVVVQGTITEVIREVPAPDLSHKDEEEIEKEQPKKNKEKGRIMATEAEWNFIFILIFAAEGGRYLMLSMSHDDNLIAGDFTQRISEIGEKD